MKLNVFNAQLLLLIVFFVRGAAAEAEEEVSVNLTGPFSAVVTVRNADGTPAGGVRYKLTYMTPPQREVVLDEGTKLERHFRFEPVRLVATIAAGIVPPDGRIELSRLAGAPRTFSLRLGDDGSRPGDFFEGATILPITFTNRLLRTNHYTVELAKTVGLGERAPDFSVEDVFTGKKLQNSDLKGKLVVLKFWATDCPPCQPEMGEFNELLVRNKKNWNNDVAFVGIGLDGDVELIRRFIRRHGWNEIRHAWPGGASNGFNSSVANSYGVRAIPACYVIHPTGLVVWRGNRGNLEWLINHFLSEVKGEREVQQWLQKVRAESEVR